MGNVVNRAFHCQRRHYWGIDEAEYKPLISIVKQLDETLQKATRGYHFKDRIKHSVVVSAA
jgi:hypothetical protein